MAHKKIYLFIGTTAELLKVAPVLYEFKKRKVNYQVISSGQGILLFEWLPKKYQNIKVNSGFEGKVNQSSLLNFIFWTLRTFVTTFFFVRKELNKKDKKNTYFLIHGDTVSSLIGAMVGFLNGVKIVHIESGLRSYNFLEPFPEELCRYIISALARIHFCPNEWSVKNLSHMRGAKVNTFQNTLIETFATGMESPSRFKLSNVKKKYYVIVFHRQEHVVFGKEKGGSMLEYILKNSKSSLDCVFLLHETTSKFLKSTGADKVLKKFGTVHMISQMPYTDFMKLIEKAEYLVTDGGSNQEEMYYMGKPCLLIRNHTERIEGIGENVVLGKSNKRIIKQFLMNYSQYKRKRITKFIAPSKIITDYLLSN